PVDGAAVSLVSQAGGRVSRTHTDADGCFAFVCLEKRAYDLTVRTRLTEATAAVVKREGGGPDTGRVEVSLAHDPEPRRPGGSVRGRVLDVGRRLRAGVKHFVSLQADASRRQVELLDATFTFRDVDSGKYRVILVSGDERVHTTSWFEVHPAEDF